MVKSMARRRTTGSPSSSRRRTSGSRRPATSSSERRARKSHGELSRDGSLGGPAAICRSMATSAPSSSGSSGSSPSAISRSLLAGLLRLEPLGGVVVLLVDVVVGGDQPLDLDHAPRVADLEPADVLPPLAAALGARLALDGAGHAALLAAVIHRHDLEPVLLGR